MERKRESHPYFLTQTPPLNCPTFQYVHSDRQSKVNRTVQLLLKPTAKFFSADSYEVLIWMEIENNQTCPWYYRGSKKGQLTLRNPRSMSCFPKHPHKMFCCAKSGRCRPVTVSSYFCLCTETMHHSGFVHLGSCSENESSIIEVIAGGEGVGGRERERRGRCRFY